MAFHARLFARLRATLTLLLAALVLVAPGMAEAATGVCAHRMAPAVEAAAPAADPDCHEMMAAPADADADHHGGSDSDDPTQSCCGAGKSCAPVTAMPGGAAFAPRPAAADTPTGLPVARYASTPLVPDYPPPRA